MFTQTPVFCGCPFAPQNRVTRGSSWKSPPMKQGDPLGPVADSRCFRGRGREKTWHQPWVVGHQRTERAPEGHFHLCFCISLRGIQDGALMTLCQTWEHTVKTLYHNDDVMWHLSGAVYSQLHAISQPIKDTRRLVHYWLLTLAGLYTLTLATRAPTLSVCTDIGGALPTAAGLWLNSGHHMPSEWKQHMSKCGTVFHKSAITH